MVQLYLAPSMTHTGSGEPDPSPSYVSTQGARLRNQPQEWGIWIWFQFFKYWSPTLPGFPPTEEQLLEVGWPLRSEGGPVSRKPPNSFWGQLLGLDYLLYVILSGSAPSIENLMFNIKCSENSTYSMMIFPDDTPWYQLHLCLWLSSSSLVTIFTFNISPLLEK